MTKYMRHFLSPVPKVFTSCGIKQAGTRTCYF